MLRAQLPLWTPFCPVSLESERCASNANKPESYRYGAPIWGRGPVAYGACLSRKISRVRVPPAPPIWYQINLPLRGDTTNT